MTHNENDKPKTHAVMPTQKIYCAHNMLHSFHKEMLEETLTRQVEAFSFLRSVSDEPFTSTWFLRIKDRIRQSAMVICLIGDSTFIDNAVLWQLTVAYTMKKRVLGVVLHPEMMHIVPDVMVSQKSRIISLQDALLRYESSSESATPLEN